MSKPASKREYEKAKTDYASWSDEQHADPTSDMLAVVDLINAYERAQNDSVA